MQAGPGIWTSSGPDGGRVTDLAAGGVLDLGGWEGCLDTFEDRAWIGLVPKQSSSGGKERLGHISKAGNRYLRKLLVVGALSVIKRAKQTGSSRRPWLVALMARRSTKVAAIALANKIARIAWAMMVRGTRYQEPLPQAA